MNQTITLSDGDILTIHCVAKPVEPPATDGLPPAIPQPALTELLEIPPVTIYQSASAQYVCFTSNLDICNDGTGPAHGDPYHQSQTAYWNGGKCLNADVDQYIVVPPQIRSMVPGVVMGCQGRATNLKTGKSFPGVIGDIGPETKTGETSYALAKLLNSTVTHNAGDDELIYFYELWPDVPAVVNEKTYKLEPA